MQNEDASLEPNKFWFRRYWIFLVIIILIIIMLIFFIFKPKNEIATSTKAVDLEGKTIKELSLLNKPIECDIINLIEKIRSERKEGEGTSVPTKIYVLGSKMRVEGISILTDGNEQPNLNIYSDNKVYSLLLDGSNKMMYLDANLIGGIDEFSDTLLIKNLDCRIAGLQDSLFVPANICYSDKEPKCY